LFDAPVLAEGPFLRPGPGPARKNIKLLGLWLLPLGLTWAQFWPAAGRGDLSGPASLLAVLAGSLAGAVAGAPAGRRRTAAADLDWLVTASLGFWMLSPPLGGLPGLVFSLAGGLAGGLISVRPGLAFLQAGPGLAALALVPMAALALEAASRLWPDLAPWPMELTWGRPAWPFVFAAAVAGLAFHIESNSQVKLRPARFDLSLRLFTWPWLAAGLLFLAGRAGLDITWLPYFDLARLAALTLPLALVIPALARTRRELIEAGLLGLVFLWLPLPATGLFALDRGLPPSAAAAAAWAWLAWRRRKTAAPARSGPEPEETAARAGLKCRGLSPLAADWRGPASCRLAAAHDGGPRRCPYGCLGLGDCRAACPWGAIDREDDGFPRPKTELCRGCGRCRAACPRGLWELAEPGGRVVIPCLSRADLKTSAELCPVGCLGCGRCRKACPAGAVAGRAGAPKVDQALCLALSEDCGLACVMACPRGLIQPPGLMEKP
jgi:Fe-S-cluster-containing hydrogenase component 2